MTESGHDDLVGPMWQDLLLDLRSHIVLILLFFVFTAVGTYTALQLITPKYQSTAALLVKLGRENLQIPATVEDGGVFSTGVRAEEINSEVALLQSLEVVEATVDKIGVEAFRAKPQVPETLLQRIKLAIKSTVKAIKSELKDLLVLLDLTQKLSERDEIILGIRGALSVERIRESDIIQIALRFPDPYLAQQVLETMLEIFAERHIEVRRNEPMEQFFSTQAEAHLERIEAIEAEMLALRADRNVGSVEEQHKQLVARLHTTLSELADSRRQLALLGGGVPAPARGASASDLTGGVSVEPIKERMTELRIQRIKLAQRYDADSRTIQAIQKELEELHRTLAESLQADVTELDKLAASIRSDIVTLNSAESRLIHLERDLALAREDYADYRERTEDARISSELDLRRVLNVSVLEKPTLPVKPVSPKKLLIMALSLPLGLLVGIGVAMLLEYLNDTVRTQRDLAGISGLNYLGAFRLKNKTRQRWPIATTVTSLDAARPDS